ncbi:uncharacterized protein [Palaemon carinicauda]|uniref:uncharacterized protein n=1 Tax=Palaemon carinicauda TaxID=392227 RepID=UPI0035B5F308
MVWCFQKARLLLLGCPNIILVTDHRPLGKVFGDRELKDIANPRLLRLKEKTLQYSFTVKYIPGKKNSAADTLSRYPVIRSSINASDREMGEEVESSCVAALMTSLSDDVITLDWNSVKRAAESDVEYQPLKSMVAACSWPVSRNLVDSSIKPYFNVRDRLGIVDELVVYSHDDGHIRLAILVSLRDQVVSNLHSGHQSSDSMIRRARQAVYWPGMEGQLKLKRMQCRTCDVIAPSQQREPLLPTPPPEYPSQQTVTDMFQMCGKLYLVYADRLTGWLEIAFFPNGATSAKLIPLFRRYFMQWGAPEEISLDGGTNLDSHFNCIEDSRARQAVYWPGMEGQLKLKRMQCRTCDVLAPSQQWEPLLPTPPPEYSFQQTVTDMFQMCGKLYLVYADRLTGWLEIAFFPNGATSAKLIPLFRRYFMQCGALEEISLDSGTNMVSTEMASFLQKWGVRMRISSAHYPQSNGRAEAAVRTAKRTIQDNTRSDGSLDTDSFARAILQYRNTPLRDIDKSPAQLAMGRQLRDSVPMIKSYHKITEQWADIMIDKEERMGKHLRKCQVPS